MSPQLLTRLAAFLYELLVTRLKILSVRDNKQREPKSGHKIWSYAYSALLQFYSTKMKNENKRTSIRK